jgi:hypothetical protein
VAVFDVLFGKSEGRMTLRRLPRNRLTLAAGSRIEIPASAPDMQKGNGAIRSEIAAETVVFVQFAASRSTRA